MNALSLSISTVITNVVPSAKIANPTTQMAQSDSSLPSSEITGVNWQPKDVSQNVEQLKSLTSTILDASGKHSYDDRLRAYSSLYEMAAKGKLAGMAVDDQKLYQTATFESDIGINAAKIQRQAGENHLAARARRENTAVAQLTFFAGLPEIDQKTDFFVNQNGFDMAGNRQYADIDAYRDQLVANAIHEYVWAAGQSQNQGNAIKGDPTGTAQTLKGVDSKVLGSSWSTHILSLLGSDKAATSGWGITNSSSQLTLTPKMPASYQPGNLFTRFG